MNDLVPSSDKINREALERIIRRAAELQAGERDIGDNLTEDQVLELGQEVGLPGRYVRQALMEEQTRAVVAGEARFLHRLMGARHVVAERAVRGNHAQLEDSLSYWMTEEELLAVKRRYRQQTSWEARRDWTASVKRSLGFGGRKYALSRAREVVGAVRSLEEGWCHVALSADLSNTRSDYLAGAAAVAIAGMTAVAVATVLSVAWPVAIIPGAGGIAGGLGIARSRRSTVERAQVALEQILDRLEHNEIRMPRSPGGGGATRSPLAKALRDEVRKHLGA